MRFVALIPQTAHCAVACAIKPATDGRLLQSPLILAIYTSSHPKRQYTNPTSRLSDQPQLIMVRALLKAAALAGVLTIALGATVAKEPVAEPSMEPSPTPTSEPVCFPGAATVQTAAGAKRMDALSVGDRVEVAKGTFSEVFMFTHKLADAAHEFVQITTASGNILRLTAGHFLPINGNQAPASVAKIGDNVELADGSFSAIVEVDTVADVGLYNPQTAHGAIVVDGVRASTYTTAVAPSAAHALLAPLRAAFGRFGIYTAAFDKGAAALAQIAPKA